MTTIDTVAKTARPTGRFRLDEPRDMGHGVELIELVVTASQLEGYVLFNGSIIRFQGNEYSVFGLHSKSCAGRRDDGPGVSGLGVVRGDFERVYDEIISQPEYAGQGEETP